MRFDSPGKEWSDGSARRRRRRARDRTGERRGEEGLRAKFLHGGPWWCREVHIYPLGGVSCNFFAPKTVRGGYRLEPARLGSDRVTWRYVIGRKSGVYCSARLRAGVAASWPSDRADRTAEKSGRRGSRDGG